MAASLVMVYISIEAPISGMGMNPARTLGSAFSAANWTAIWIYFTAPPLGMLMAAEFYVRSRGAGQPWRVLCVKLCTTTTASVASFGAIIPGEGSMIRIFPASKCFQERVLH